MVTILPREESFGSTIGRGLGGGVSQGLEMALKNAMKKKEYEREFTDKLGLQAAKEKSDIGKIDYQERLKHQLKQELQQEKQTYLNELLGGKSSKTAEEPKGERTSEFDPTNISDEDIARITAKDANIGRSLQHSKDVGLREKTAARKEVGESFKENQQFIDKSHDQYEDTLRREAITDRMNELQESGELSDSGMINLLESLGLKQEWLKNPANEEYTKLSLDLLGGGTLQADYGSRVLQSEFKVSQLRIPTLSQTPEGRRQITENIKTMLLPAKLKHERLQFYLDQSERTGKSLPHDLRGRVLKDIKPQLEESYDKFKQRNGRYQVKTGTFPDDDALEKYFFIANGNEEKAIKMMKEDGYDIES